MRFRLALSLSVAAVALSGCVPDLSPWEVGRGPRVVDAGRLPEGACTRSLFGNAVSGTSSTCFFDERVSGGTGVLEYECGGGQARITFGEHLFVGTYSAGFVDVFLSTSYMHDVGRCDWITEQRITGLVDEGRLDYAYDEAPAPGQSGCAGPCAGSAIIDVR